VLGCGDGAVEPPYRRLLGNQLLIGVESERSQALAFEERPLFERWAAVQVEAI
jgi:hypothetical protein